MNPARMLLSVLAVALAVPTGASAATAGHYTGTTAQNYPIEFDVVGSTVTNVVTTANGTCNGGPAGPGALRQMSTNSTYAFPIAGDAFDGYDEDAAPYLKFRGTFVGNAASGTLDTFTGGTYFNGYVNAVYGCPANQVPWSASLVGAGDPGGGDPGGGDPGGGDPGGGDPGGGDPGTNNPGGGSGGAPSVSVSFPTGVLLKPSLSSGFVVSVGVDQPATLKAKLIVGRKDANKYGLGKKAVTVSKDTVTNAGADSSFEFTFKKAIAKKLKKAKRITFTLEITAIGADGVPRVTKVPLKLV